MSQPEPTQLQPADNLVSAVDAPKEVATRPPAPASAHPADSGVKDGSYSLVAWPPPRLDGWLRKLQEELGISGFGVPHINIRAPFQTELTRRELMNRFREALDGADAFEVTVKGFKRYKSVIFLECEASARMLYLHMVALGVGPSTRSPYDGESYAPHLTLALGLLPWAEDELWQQITARELPVTRFRVSALSLTIEEKGEFIELHTFPLREPPPAEEQAPKADEG